jgi:glycosyltransferase involved in cell wall biosynthesis
MDEYEIKNIRIMPNRFLDSYRDKVRDKFPKLEGPLRILTVRRLWEILKVIKELAPKAIWVHQIGWRVPITSLLMFRALKIPVVFTVHDYSFLRFRKLYTDDFKYEKIELQKQLESFHESCSSLWLKLRVEENFWQFCMRKLFECNISLVYVSALQSEIYRSNGYPRGRVITNTLRPCECEVALIPKYRETMKLQILFAGRLIGKGLERVLASVLASKNVHLHLAGGEDLFASADKVLPRNLFTYHGILKESELHLLIHSVDLTVVASNCFDAFPTITLESFAHGKPVISTPLTGNFSLAMKLGKLFTLPLDGLIPFDEILEHITEKSLKVNLGIINRYVTDEKSIFEYRELFESVLNKNSTRGK